jgi:hypothetical protein
MTFRTVFMITVIAGIAFALYRSNSDPLGTRLPFGSTDLTTVEKELSKLPADERALVEGYVKRSNGDVLPQQFADPDNPLTARTFGEAIKLQRDWEVKQKVVDARVAELRAEREAKLAPLRAAVRASVVKAEVITRNEYHARRDPDFYKRAYTVDKSPTFITRIRVQNLSAHDIVTVRGSLQAKDSEAYLPMDLCWIDLGTQQPIASGGSIELTCGHDYRGASQQQQDFIVDTKGRFNVVWEPRYIKFADGRELDSGL